MSRLKGKIEPIQSADKDAPSSTLKILGQFEGECADANVTNENGLDILPAVWETVFASDLYKKALEHGWYIGFLGHPEDPNCMDFEHACIVMRECHIDNGGKVYGKFDLIDTPVGRIVKAFIDAGVIFGISVRGAGDIVDNSVDPDTFVFRGFDLVTFPAYTEAIPTFTEIAASTDFDKQKKYKAVCAAVKKNIEGLNTCEAIDIVQSQFAKQSDEYQMLEDRKAELDPEENIDISADQLAGMTQLYLDAKEEADNLQEENQILRQKLALLESTTVRKLKAIQRITSAQRKDLEDELFAVTNKYQTVKASSEHLKSENLELQSSNLKYKQRVEATATDIRKKSYVISRLQSKLDETVVAAEEQGTRTSNLDAIVKKLRKEVSAATALVQEYQEAYANLYANALGVHLEDVRVTSSTTVKDLQKIIGSASSSSQQASIMEPTHIDAIDDEDDDDGVGLVTM